ncbi:MAG TPA: DUF5667 domain-containing protein [Actinomycetota bacterium]|nr:DUF5667 domain-containing protein [Actinomycetota bacterium]
MSDRETPIELQGVEARVTEALSAKVPADVAARHEALLLSKIRQADRSADATVVTLPVRSPGRIRTLAVLAAALVLVVGTSAVAFAADPSGPGDPLYGLDRALERVQLAASRDPGSRASTHLELAAERLREADKARSGRLALEAVRDAAKSFDLALAESTTGLGTDEGRLREHVLAAISKHIDRLQAVRAKLEASSASPKALFAIDRAIANGSKAAEAQARAGNSGPGSDKPGDTVSEPGAQPTDDGSGQGNSGSGNQGQGNQGQGNSGSGNQGQGNSGSGNQGQGNSGSGEGAPQGSPGAQGTEGRSSGRGSGGGGPSFEDDDQDSSSGRGRGRSDAGSSGGDDD